MLHVNIECLLTNMERSPRNVERSPGLRPLQLNGERTGPLALAILFLTFISRFAGAETKVEKGSAIFYGVVQAVDLGNKTFTIQAQGRSYVFHYNEQTKISSAKATSVGIP